MSGAWAERCAGACGLPCLCAFGACQCAACFAATVLAREKPPICASFGPLGVYIYAVGAESCATRLVFAGSAPLAAAKQAAFALLWEFVARLGASASLPLHAPPLPRPASAVCVAMLRRRNTASLPCSHPSAQSANRVAACRSVRHSTPRQASSSPIRLYLFLCHTSRSS